MTVLAFVLAGLLMFAVIGLVDAICPPAVDSPREFWIMYAKMMGGFLAVCGGVVGLVLVITALQKTLGIEPL